jgi:K+-transporting ATPase, KdpF subunit
MKTTEFLIVAIQAEYIAPRVTDMNTAGWYLAGGCIAICLIAYLIYSLIKPEKF